MSSESERHSIDGLSGEYCADCCRSLVDFHLAKFSIVPMCREDLHQFLNNGDMARVAKMMDEKEPKNA